jgi:hypothetical protein
MKGMQTMVFSFRDRSTQMATNSSPSVASFFCRKSVLKNSVAARTFAIAQWSRSCEQQPTVPVCCLQCLFRRAKAAVAALLRSAP